jgi:drug/metabolite transporter (DMT)-like permease
MFSQQVTISCYAIVIFVMSWQIAIGLSILAGATATLVQRAYSLKSKAPATFPSAISYLLGVMPVGIIVGLSLPHDVHWSWELGLLLIICASSVAVSGWVGFKAVKLMPVAPYQTIGRFTAIVAIALGWVVLGEKLSLPQLIGAGLLLVAALFAAWSPVKNIQAVERQIHLQAVILALISATFMGIGLVTEKAILGHTQVGGVLIFGWGSQTLAMLLLALKDASRTNLRKFGLHEIRWSWLMGLFNGIGGAFYVYSLSTSNNISVITALTAVTLPLTVLGAHFILKERENNRLMLFSLTLCFIGLLVFAL